MLRQSIIVLGLAICHVSSIAVPSPSLSDPVDEAENVARIILRPHEVLYGAFAHDGNYRAVISQPALYSSMLESGNALIRTILHDTTPEHSNPLLITFENYLRELRTQGFNPLSPSRRQRAYHDAIYSRLHDLQTAYPEEFVRRAASAKATLRSRLDLFLRELKNYYTPPIGTTPSRIAPKEQKVIGAQPKLRPQLERFRYLSEDQVLKELNQHEPRIDPSHSQHPANSPAATDFRQQEKASASPSQYSSTGGDQSNQDNKLAEQRSKEEAPSDPIPRKLATAPQLRSTPNRMVTASGTPVSVAA